MSIHFKFIKQKLAPPNTFKLKAQNLKLHHHSTAHKQNPQNQLIILTQNSQTAQLKINTCLSSKLTFYKPCFLTIED